jgi:hypothetical protein
MVGFGQVIKIGFLSVKGKETPLNYQEKPLSIRRIDVCLVTLIRHTNCLPEDSFLG